MSRSPESLAPSRSLVGHLRSNGIIAGHGCLAAARKLGMTEVPVIELFGLSESKKRAYILADNKLALDAGWDDDLLRVEIEDLKDEGFDLAMRAAQTAIAEAQARINAHFSEKVLTGFDCASAVQSVNDSMDSIADAPGKMFGEFQLTFGPLTSDGAAVPVTVSFNGAQLGTDALGTLVAPQCTGSSGEGTSQIAAGPVSLRGFDAVTKTGTCGSSGSVIGVVAKYSQINCTNSWTEDMIDVAAEAFAALLPTLGDPFNSLDDVGYWHYFDDPNRGTKSLIWTETDISTILGPERVPFIQVSEAASGEKTYYVGLTTVGTFSKDGQTQSAMMIQDGYGIVGRIWSEDFVGASNKQNITASDGSIVGGRYVAESNGSYMFADQQQGFTDYQQALDVY